MATFTKCSRQIINSVFNSTLVKTENRVIVNCFRNYAKDDGCRRALVDIPSKKDPVCPEPCDRWGSRKSKFIHKIKLKIIEGGTNFGTPFRRVRCQEPDEKAPKKMKGAKVKALPAPKKPQKEDIPVPEPRPGVQVSILGADTSMGQYLALLLKQCPTIKKLRLYEAKLPKCGENRTVCRVAQDLLHIDTNCEVQAFNCAPSQLERCLQNTDIVVMLESASLNMEMPVDMRFHKQAPTVKMYADAIATECPNAFLIICAAPIDCMVPLVAQIFKETGFYDPRKLMGSMAVPEMRASTLAARAMGLEPRYTRVPCVGGTEGEALVPLFSRAIEYFDFSPQSAAMMTEAVRVAPVAVSKAQCARAADLSEAHALARLVINVSQGLLCHDLPRISGFVETDAGQVISPARFIGSPVELGRIGIKKSLGIPKLTPFETHLVDVALHEIQMKMTMVMNWYQKSRSSVARLDKMEVNFFKRRGNYPNVDDCAYANF